MGSTRNHNTALDLAQRGLTWALGSSIDADGLNALASYSIHLAASMLKDLAKVIVEDLFGLAVQGMFRRSQTWKILRLKIAAWLCLGFAAVLVTIGVLWPQLINFNTAVGGSLIAALVALSFGFSASVQHIRTLPVVNTSANA